MSQATWTRFKRYHVTVTVTVTVENRVQSYLSSSVF